MRTNQASSATGVLQAVLTAGCLLSACSGDSQMTTDGTSGGETSGSSDVTSSSSATSSSSESTGAAPTSDATAGATEDPDPSGFDPPDPVCGDGFVEGDEQCDDGNTDDDDACTNECLVPCGIEWSALEPAPTLESVIAGWHVARDDEDNVYVAGRVREVIVDQEENVTEGPDSIALLKYNGDGALVWSQTVVAGMGDSLVRGLVVDGASGELVIAATIDGVDGEDIWVGRFADEAVELWTFAYDSPFDGGDDQAAGIALAPGGDVVVSGRVAVSDKDTDVWVARLDGDSGELAWMSAYSGEFNNEFSVDRGGPVAVASDGAVYVTAQEYVDYQTSEGTLIRFAGDGSGPEWTLAPQADGSTHDHTSGPIAIDSQDNVLFAVVRPGVGGNFWIYKVDAQQEVLWTRGRNDFKDMDYSWLLSGVGVGDSDELVVGGYWTNEIPGEQISWFEAWWARLASDDGAIECQLSYQEPSDELLPPSLAVLDVTASPEGGALLTGEQNIEGELAVWTARFRP